MSLSPGNSLGPYEIVRLVGAGGMGEVYEARDTRLDRRVAIKVIRTARTADPIARARFEHEARSVSTLEHPHICPLYDVGHKEGLDFIVMQFLEGETLDARLRRQPLAADEVLRIGIDVARGLEHAHRRGLVHRDLKPANVMLTATGAKLMDFGLATQSSDDVEAVTRSGSDDIDTGGIAGTLQYMSPEVLHGDPADARSDIWSLGVTLYEAVAGTLPFTGRTRFDLTSAILRDSPGPLPGDVPPALVAIISRCLEKDPLRRYQQAGEARAALEALQVDNRPRAMIQTRPPVRRVPRRLALVAVLAALGAIAAALLWIVRVDLTEPATPPPIRSIAVLPFVNLSGDADQEYIADGVTEALITELGQIRMLRVISRQSVMLYKDKPGPPARIAARLGVDTIIEGTVFHAAQRIRITVRLIRAAPESQLWAGTYERSFGDILTLSSQVAQEAASQVRVTLTPQEQAMLARQRPVTPEAYQAYLLGRYFWNRRTKEGIERAIKEFKRAIAADPASPLAHAGLADCYLVAADLGLAPPDVALSEARKAAATALRLDDLLAEAHASLGVVHTFDHRWADAEREYRRAFELKPGYAPAHQWLAINLSALGRHDEAIAEARRALELDPLSLLLNTFLGQRLYLAGRYDEAIAQLRRTIELDPTFLVAHHFVGRAYLEKHQYNDAIRAFRLAVGAPTIAEGSLGHAYAISGDVAAAKRTLRDLLERTRREYVAPYQIALVYVGLGDRERAIEWLLKAASEPGMTIGELATDPRLAGLRDDPRIQEVLRRSGIVSRGRQA